MPPGEAGPAGGSFKTLGGEGAGGSPSAVNIGGGITINMPVTQSVSQLTSTANARTVATQIVDQVNKMATYRSIASGANS